MRLAFGGAFLLVLMCQPAAAQDQQDAWVGCWGRVYDAAHLAKHKGQTVTGITAVIDPRTPAGEQDPGPHAARVAATLRGNAETLTTLAPARCAHGGDAATELRCVLDGFFIGQFRVERAGKNLKLVLRDRDGVVVVPGVDLGAFIRLTPENPEQAAFLLNPQPASACGD